MSKILSKILTLWQSDRPNSAEHIITFYIAHPDSIRCTVAISEAREILGFQSLKRLGPDNAYNLPVGWGVIGTYVCIDAPRRGIGRALYNSSFAAAKVAGLKSIDATIGRNNTAGLAYYSAMGFEDYRSSERTISKVLRT